MGKSAPPKRNVIVIGATGAVGTSVLQRLQNMPEVARVTALVRRPLDAANTKVTSHVVDVLDSASYARYLQGHDAAICTLGVGQPSKVSHEEFRRIDHDAVLGFAKACHAAGIGHFELLGSVAADAASRSFYLRSKGELREAIAGLGFPRFSAFQPSMLITRTNRYGLGQGVLLTLWPLLSPLLMGGLAKYRGITVERLGTAMADNLLTQEIGAEILHWREIVTLAKSLTT